MKRVLEPELMDDVRQAKAYAQANFAEENQGFVDRFRDYFPSGPAAMSSISDAAPPISPSDFSMPSPMRESPAWMPAVPCWIWLKKLSPQPG